MGDSGYLNTQLSIYLITENGIVLYGLNDP